MNKMRNLVCAALAAVTLAMTGCISVPGTITDKTKPIEQNKYTVVGEEVSATECTVSFFGIPLSDLRGSAGRRMYKNCLQQAPGADALIEYTKDVKYIFSPIPFIPITITWYTLTGTPVKTDK